MFSQFGTVKVTEGMDDRFYVEMKHWKYQIRLEMYRELKGWTSTVLVTDIENGSSKMQRMYAGQEKRLAAKSIYDQMVKWTTQGSELVEMVAFVKTDGYLGLKCCNSAKKASCVCIEKRVCKYHGEFHHGTHD